MLFIGFSHGNRAELISDVVKYLLTEVKACSGVGLLPSLCCVLATPWICVVCVAGTNKLKPASCLISAPTLVRLALETGTCWNLPCLDLAAELVVCNYGVDLLVFMHRQSIWCQVACRKLDSVLPLNLTPWSCSSLSLQLFRGHEEMRLSGEGSWPCEFLPQIRASLFSAGNDS